MPFDLTTLQRECNKYFGYSAKQTLDYAQSLYEKKLITYPRTGSRCLTEDMITSTINNILGKLKRLEEKLVSTKEQLENAKEELKKPFKKADELKTKILRLAELKSYLIWERWKKKKIHIH